MAERQNNIGGEGKVDSHGRENKQELFRKSFLEDKYYQSIKYERTHAQDRESIINKTFNKDCIKEESIPDLPIFSKIKNKSLRLVNYAIGPGLSKALSNFLSLSNYRVNQNYLIQHLHLDDNNLVDEDFMSILAGLTEQLQLKSLFYANNEFGMKSVEQLSLLVDN